MNRSTPVILMCSPDYYGIEYEINPWMNRTRGSDPAVSREQWRGLRALIEGCGAQVELLSPQPGLPDLVFTANAAMMYRERAFLARFRHPARQGETAIDRGWLETHGYTCVELPAGMDFEGAGDALFCGETLFGGYLIRSDARALQWVAAEIGCAVIPVQLVDDRYYHLDTCFCPLRPGLAAWYPPAFDDYGRQAIAARVEELIAVNDEEAARFACNAVVIGEQVIVNSGCPHLTEDLEAAGFTVHATPLDEFIKAGGSAKCLTLRLDGEEAADWAH